MAKHIRKKTMAFIMTVVMVMSILPALSPPAMAASFNDSFSTDPGLSSIPSSFTSTLGGDIFTYTFASDGDGGDFSYDPHGYGLGDSGSVYALSLDEETSTTEKITITRAGSASFVFTSIFINNDYNLVPVTVAGYKNGSLVGSAQSVPDNSSATLNFSDIVVDEVRMTATNIDTYIDEFQGNTTAGAAPTVTTQDVSSIGVTTATGNGNITDLGSDNPTAHGVCWNTAGMPTTSDSHMDNGGISATGAFTSSITGLTANTKYYVRAYATNTVGTSYGAQVSFTTFGPDINIQGNGTSIASGDSTPSETDYTDFGSVAAASGTIARTFTIQNTGTAVLTLTGTPLVDISGTNAADFSVNSAPSTPVAAAGSTTFQITFDPSAVGTSNATVSIASDDSDEAMYTFSIRGTGLNTAPAVSGLPSDIIVVEDTASDVDLSAAVFSDDDSDALTVTLTASAGTFAAASGGSVTVSGSGMDTLTLSGTAANINTYLDTVTNIKYTGAANANGDNAATFTVHGNDGTVNPLLGTGNLDITAVNDDPGATGLPTDITVTENTASNVDLSAVTLSDPDSDTNDITLTLAVGSGTLSASDGGGVTVSGSGTDTLTLAGTATAIDAYLNTASNIQYTGAADTFGDNATTLTLTANDGGKTGTGGGTDVSLGLVNIDIMAMAPAVTNVTSTKNDGTYGLGETIAVTVTFSKPVTVTGTPQLTLETGTTDRTIDYTGGSTTDTLTFTYTVQAGDESADLDYTSVNALTLNGGTIKRDTTNAVLTLPAPGTAGSLGANKALVIDGTAPTVTVVVSDTALKAGETSLVTITFSEPVTGFANDDLTIENGSLSAVSSGDGGTTYTAILTPTADMEDAANAIALDLTGVSDAAGNNGSGTASSNSYAIDTKRPTATVALSKTAFYSGETATVTFTFTEAVTDFANGDLTVENGTLTAVSSADGNITFTATFTADNVNDTTNTITLDLTGVDDAAGNTGSGTAVSVNYSIAIPTVPGAPTGVTAVAGDTQATVSFTPPASNGGAAITTYTATSNPGGITVTGAGSPITVTGLTNGTAYTFTVTATNSVGTGAASAPSNSVTPRAAQTITFGNPGAQNFGTTPTLTATASSGLTVTFTSETPSVCTITPSGTLTFLSAGTATITASQAGDGSFLPAAPVSQSFTVNPVVPGAPTGVTAAAGDTQATVSFTPPASNGGATITTYTATSSPGGFTGTSAGSPITVTGLTNGTAYTFTVTATNGVGTGPASAASNSVTPRTAQTITFTDPGAQDFGTNPTLTATASSGLTVTFTSETPSVCTITPSGTLTFLSAGTATITASQAGDGSFLPAAPVSRSFTVNPVVPGAPTGVTATAGNGQATVSFTAPASNGGAAITSYTVTSAPGGITATGTASPITVTGLTNGTAYTFTVTATNIAGMGPTSAPSGSVTPQVSVYVGGGDTGESGESTDANVEVNGTPYSAGTIETTTNSSGQTVTTFTVDTQQLQEILDNQGRGATVTIPVTTGSDVAAGVLTGDMVGAMQEKGATLVIETDGATYTLPAEEIDIGAVSEQLGVSPADITVTVSVSAPADDMVTVVEDAAGDGGYTLVVPAVEFTVTCAYGDQTVDITTFNAYVDRTITIPDGVDPNLITTAVVVGPDGSTRSVPTEIIYDSATGHYVAVIHSLTNSVYAVIYNPVEFADVADHWARDAVNDMGARMIVTGDLSGNYNPDNDMTRAEFATVIVRALGLSPDTGANSFGDVKSSDWFCGYVETAVSYGIINGYGNGTFGPNDQITREQAMAMLARAMKITGLEIALTDSEISELLGDYTDDASVSDFAANSIVACVKAGIVSGRDDNTLAPQAYVTRAEVAVMVQRLLQKSELIKLKCSMS